MCASQLQISLSPGVKRGQTSKCCFGSLQLGLYVFIYSAFFVCVCFMNAKCMCETAHLDLHMHVLESLALAVRVNTGVQTLHTSCCVRWICV